MSIASAIVLYAVIWFLTLFIVIPIRLRTQGDDGLKLRGTHAGSPVDAQMKKRALITTGVAFVIWAVAAGIIVSGRVGIEDFDLFHRFGGGGQPYSE